jgi:hypothetical protein
MMLQLMRDGSDGSKARKWRKCSVDNMASMPGSLLGSRYSSMVSLGSRSGLNKSASLSSFRSRMNFAEEPELDIYKDEDDYMDFSDDSGVGI